jgi:hypothetical protein
MAIINKNNDFSQQQVVNVEFIDEIGVGSRDLWDKVIPRIANFQSLNTPNPTTNAAKEGFNYRKYEHNEKNGPSNCILAFRQIYV